MRAVPICMKPVGDGGKRVITVMRDWYSISRKTSSGYLYKSKLKVVALAEFSMIRTKFGLLGINSRIEYIAEDANWQRLGILLQI